mgnify:CR=1 FL=1
MSVGAGSIKRAAKAAQPVQTEEKAVKQEQEVKQTESKAAETKAAKTKAASTKAAGNKTVVKKAETQPVKEKKAEGVEQKRYGVGEELPVFLM